MERAQSPDESETYPKGNPGIAYDLMRDRLMYQQMAVDGLDNKLAVGFSASGLVLTIMAGFLASKGTDLETRDVLFLAVVGILFAFTLKLAVSGLRPMDWKGVTWDDILEKTGGEWPKEGVKWSVAKQLAIAGDENEQNLTTKRKVLPRMLGLLVAEIVVATVGLGLSVS